VRPFDVNEAVGRSRCSQLYWGRPDTGAEEIRPDRRGLDVASER